MASDEDIVLLSRIGNTLFPLPEPCGDVDIEPELTRHGLDLAKIMGDIAGICERRDYFAGGHMECTRVNVLPFYYKTGRVEVDRDHFSGLVNLLAIENGIRDDY